MHDWFDYNGHVCITFDMLGISVYDFLVSTAIFVYLFVYSSRYVPNVAKEEYMRSV